ncbi:MAG: AraC family transcriptional regulator [Steroidobacteraceae bacterium]
MKQTGDLAVRADALRNFGDLVASFGGDPDALLQKWQVDPAILANRNGVISYRKMLQLLERASVELDSPDFGVRLAVLQEGTKTFDPLEIAVRNSPTLGQAFRYCADHIHAYSTATQICFEKTDDHRVFMRFEILLARLAQHRQVVEHALARIQNATMAISRGQARAREVWFTHEPLAPMSIYRNHFNATPRFRQSMNGLLFTEEELDLSVLDTDPQLYEIATRFIEHRFPSSAVTLSTRVHSIIARLLVEGNCTHERVTSALGLHPRTLQRRLRDEGESFESIRDSVRRDVALRYLQQPNVPLVRVTEILGYSETSVLSRSCHRWFSASPRQLRNELTR